MKPQISEVFQVFFGFVDNAPWKDHDKITSRASLEPQGPRDRACGKEREVLCKIALTRALYNQTAPQLCHVYVPGKLRSFSSFLSVETWPLGQLWKSDFPTFFFCLKINPLTNHDKNDCSGIHLTPGPSGPRLWKRAGNSMQDSLNERSVRPNGTSVVPILRFRKTHKCLILFCWDMVSFSSV